MVIICLSLICSAVRSASSFRMPFQHFGPMSFCRSAGTQVSTNSACLNAATPCDGSSSTSYLSFPHFTTTLGMAGGWHVRRRSAEPRGGGSRNCSAQAGIIKEEGLLLLPCSAR